MRSQAVTNLRCDRCRHLWCHHGLQGCLVAKMHWDDDAKAFVSVDPCICKWYIGELPPLETHPACPHEVQDEAESKAQRRICVHCGSKVK